jgi:acyl-[acyl-carrier-protein]-phospholipid O-acyltransferase/long-chain-fatty-acid--[acyl-carrier-protein] ligase
MNKIRAFIGRTFIGRWYKRYWDYVELCLTSGYIPRAQPKIWKVSQWLFRLWAWIQVGRVTVIGGEHLDTPGRVIYCPNHSSMLDAMIIHPLMRRRVRYMGAREVMMGGFGLKAIIMTSMGVFPVDRSRGKTVLGPATDLLVAGESLCLFPEGKISPSGRFLPYKRGAAVIAGSAWRKLGGKELVAIVPIHICYHKRHEASALNYLKMGLRWRGGCTVTVMEPIWISERESRDSKYVIGLVRAAIASVACPTTCAVPEAE